MISLSNSYDPIFINDRHLLVRKKACNSTSAESDAGGAWGTWHSLPSGNGAHVEQHRSTALSSTDRTTQIRFVEVVTGCSRDAGEEKSSDSSETNCDHFENMEWRGKIIV
jgi:hypothetical protein